MSFPYIAATAGWILTEMGRQPWIVQNLLKTSDAVSTGLSTATVAASLTVFVLLYAALGVVDFILMRHYARLDPPQVDRPGTGAPMPASPSRSEVNDMGLEEVWFVLIGVLWSGYFLLEGFDFGVGMLLPVLPRDERERGLMFESIGPVWDGNEVWLVVAAGATFAAFPAWYATLFSGFYVALLLILVLLIVRVVSFEWREKHDGRALARDLAVGEHDRERRRPFLWGVALANLVQGVPLDSSHVFTGGIIDLFSAYTVAAGLAVVAMFATARRHLSDAADRRRPPRTSVPHRPATGGARHHPRRRRRRMDGARRTPQQRSRDPADDRPGRADRDRARSSRWCSHAPTETAGRSRPRDWAPSASSPPSSPASTRGCSSRIPPSPTA